MDRSGNGDDFRGMFGERKIEEKTGISLDVTWRGFENRPMSRLSQITVSLHFYPFSVSRVRDHPLPFQFAANSWNRKKNRSFSFLFFFFFSRIESRIVGIVGKISTVDARNVNEGKLD